MVTSAKLARVLAASTAASSHAAIAASPSVQARSSHLAHMCSQTGIPHDSSTTAVPFYYNDIYEVVMPERSSFPMEKYKFIRLALQRELEGLGKATFHPSPLATVEDLCTVHTEEYVRRYLANELSRLENRRIGFPWTTEHRDRALSSTGGTIAAMRAVCGRAGKEAPRFSGHIAGGTHHAFSDRGEGYCVFNDIAVAAAVALRDYPDVVRRVLLVDLDVHQGNGSARIFEAESRVQTYSQHCEGNLFSARERSDLDVDVPVGSGDDVYLAALEAALPGFFERSAPDLIFFQAGVDPHEADRIGRLELTSAGLKRRNAVVFDLAVRHGARLVLTLGGGYPKDLDIASAPFHQVVQSHMDCYRQCAASHAKAVNNVS